MMQSMLHEPFYASGTYSAQELGIYCGWIAHPNSFASGQVFQNKQEGLVLIFSGECFLDSESAALLRRQEHPLAPSNGSWLLQLYLEYREQFFEKLNGLFSGILIDEKQKKAFLFNDRYGMERIYWHENKETFYFASEAKALLRVLPQLRKFDWHGVAEFLTLGCISSSRTLFEGVQLLPTASRWGFEGVNHTREQYFSPEKWEAQSGESLADFEAEFEETFKRIVPRYFESASSLGISLTAGLDGRMIMACLPDGVGRPICYTFVGQTQNTLDALLASRVAAACGLEHQSLRIGQDFFTDFSSHADKTVYVSDGCLGLLGTHEIYMNQQARRLAPVRVTGVFGGEILREVSFSKPPGLNPRVFNPRFTLVRDIAQNESSYSNQHPVTSAITSEIPQRRFGVVSTARSQTIFRTPYLDNELVALAYRTPTSLRCSTRPAFSLVQHSHPELSRIPTDMGHLGNSGAMTALVRKLFARITFKLDYFYNEGLPHRLSRFDSLLATLNSKAGILGRHKFLRYRSWFRDELREYVGEMLREAAKRQAELWDSKFLEQMAIEHRTGRKNYVAEINAVLTLEAVDRTLIRSSTG